MLPTSGDCQRILTQLPKGTHTKLFMTTLFCGGDRSEFNEEIIKFNLGGALAVFSHVTYFGKIYKSKIF